MLRYVPMEYPLSRVPVVGGFLCESKGWRWVFWVLTIVVCRSHLPIKITVNDRYQSGVVTVAALLLMKETYAPVLLARKAARLRKEQGSKADSQDSKHGVSIGEEDILLRSITRPVKMFIFSPIVTAMCVYIAVAYGLLYILFT